METRFSARIPQRMMFRRRSVLVVAVVLAMLPLCWGQKGSNWRVYRVTDGLPESACVSVTVSALGKVVARHYNLPLLTVLDGYEVSEIPAPEMVQSRAYQSPGGQLWSVVPGGLQEYRDGNWAFYPVPEIAAQTNRPMAGVIDPVPLCPVRHGLVILLLSDRLLELNCDRPEQPRTRVLRWARDTSLRRFLGLAPAHDGGLWVSGASGLARIPGPLRMLTPTTEWHEYPVPENERLHDLLNPREDVDGGVVAMAESSTNRQKLLVYFDSQRWLVSPPVLERLRQAWRGPDQNGWATTMNALWQWEPGSAELTENDEIFARQYFDVAIEPSGAFWLATSDGLFRYAQLSWGGPRSVRKLAGSVHCLASDTPDRLWFVAGGKLYSLSEQELKEFSLPVLNRFRLQPRAIFALGNGTLVLDAGDAESGMRDQLFGFQPLEGRFYPVPQGTPTRHFRALGLLRDGTLCVSALDTKGNCALEKYDGLAFEPLASPPPAQLGTNLSTALAAQNGDLWISGEFGTAYLHEKLWRVFASADKTTPAAVVGFVEMPEGKVWCATQEQIWEFDGHAWAVVRGDFDRINAFVRTRDGTIWVASNNGLHRYFQGGWIENGIEEGLPTTTVREVFEQGDQLWAATTHGLRLYNPKADRDPPEAFVQKLGGEKNSSAEGSTITMLFSGIDKWKFTPPERLLYSYRLDEREWSPFQEATRVSFAELPAGMHYFQVRAMDRNCNIGKPARLDFTVVLPWYKEGRLVAISVAGLVGALFFAGLAFNRHRRLLHSYADIEKKVNERTAQLDLANRQLLQSQKMTALGTLAAGIAHDFNNILSIVKGSAQIIEDNLDNPDKVRTRADRIKLVVEQGAGMVKAMLGFSRESGQQAEPCEINAVVEDTLKLLGDRFLREVQVRFEPAAGLPAVSASKDIIQQILLNFIFNAAEAQAQNKQVVIRTSPLEKAPADAVLAPSTASRYVWIEVKDYGCGIPSENLTRIFEPFFTTKALSTHRGTGLGLSMAYELARKLGAGLAVKSRLDHGSTFSLILPVNEKTPEPPRQSPLL